jgi:hypothetical protein
LSNQAAADFLDQDFDRRAAIVMLAHLSGNNNHPEIARLYATEALGRVGAADTQLVVAEQKRPSEVYRF